MFENLKSILVIEDEPADFALLHAGFEAAQYSGALKHAATTEAAYRWIANSLAEGNGLPGLILLDLRLPGESGLEVIRKFKRTPELAEIILVVYSGSTDVGDIAMTRRMGADWFFSKDGSLEELEHTIRTLDTLCDQRAV